MTTATFVKAITGAREGQSVILWKLSPPQNGGDLEYVITSAVDLVDPLIEVFDTMLGAEMASCETYIFPANKDGEVLNWTELWGSTKHIKDHEQVIRNAGWEVVNGSVT
jgi:hypothetical protein